MQHTPYDGALFISSIMSVDTVLPEIYSSENRRLEICDDNGKSLETEEVKATLGVREENACQKSSDKDSDNELRKADYITDMAQQSGDSDPSSSICPDTRSKVKDTVESTGLKTTGCAEKRPHPGSNSGQQDTAPKRSRKQQLPSKVVTANNQGPTAKPPKLQQLLAPQPTPRMVMLQTPVLLNGNTATIAAQPSVAPIVLNNGMLSQGIVVVGANNGPVAAQNPVLLKQPHQNQVILQKKANGTFVLQDRPPPKLAPNAPAIVIEPTGSVSNSGGIKRRVLPALRDELYCYVCEEKFATAQTCRNHLKQVHKSEFPCKFPYCRAVLENNYKLRNHLVSKHKAELGLLATEECAAAAQRKETTNSAVATATDVAPPLVIKQEPDDDVTTPVVQSSSPLPHMARFKQSEPKRVQKVSLKVRENLEVEHSLQDDTDIKAEVKEEPLEDGVGVTEADDDYLEEDDDVDDEEEDFIPDKDDDLSTNWQPPRPNNTADGDTETDQSQLICYSCGKKFPSLTKFRRHMKLHNQPSDVGVGSSGLECKICGLRCPRNYILRNHLRTHTGEKPYQCGECDARFAHHSALIRHKKIHTGELPHKCPECEKRFLTSGQVRSHLKTHTGEKPYECQVCQARFPRAYSLNLHMRTHTGERRYRCEVCDSRFRDTYQLKTHMRTHTGEKPYKCRFCNQKFAQKHSLFTHEQSLHEREIVDNAEGNWVAGHFRCYSCNGAYKTQKGLDAHISAVHQAEKNVECSRCEEKLSSTDALAAHERKMHGQARPFKCDQCEKRFASRSQLKVHVTSHVAITFHQCQFCEAKFTEGHVLMAHIRRLHESDRAYHCSMCDQLFDTPEAVQGHMAAEHDYERA